MRHFVRTILTLGAGLRLEREFRDILVDIVRAGWVDRVARVQAGG